MFQSKTCLGVDVSDKDIRVVELRKSGDRYEVTQTARIEIGSNDAAAVLRQFLLETGTNASKIVWSLPTNSCSVKLAGLPWTKPAEIARMARYEAETQIPLPLSDLIWDYTIEKPAKGEELSHVVIAAARRSSIEEYVSLMEAESVTLSSAMVASLADVLGLRNTIRAFNEPVFIVNIGDEWTDLTAVDRGNVLSCRSVHMGIKELASAVASDRGISLPEAREVIAVQGVLSGFDASEKVQYWLGNLSLEIRRSALASMSGTHGMPVKAAVLTGEGTAVIGLAEAISAKANLTVEIGNPWSGMSLSSVTTHNKRDIPGIFSVATGLAISGLDGRKTINLMPGDRAEEQIRQRKDMKLLSSLGIAAIVLFIILLSGYAGVRAKSEELENLKIRTSTAKSQVKKVPSELSATATTMENIVKDLENRDSSPVEILRQLSVGLPKSCWLTEFRYESGKTVLIRGNALSNSAVADAVYLLSSTSKFESVSLDYSNLGKNAKSPVYEFQIKCQLPPNVSLGQLTKKVSKERTTAR